MSRKGEEDLEIGGRAVTIKNLDKPLFPAADKSDPVTKGQVVDYYRRIAPTILPHLKGRPVSLQRCPDGIDDCFFQKDVPDYFPDWIARAPLPAENKTVDYVQVEDEATLAYLANQAAIVLHVGLAPADTPKRPDRLVFDLDPPGDDFAAVRWAAGVLREAFGTLGMPCFAMTTGSRGMHVVVPLDRSADFDAVKAFARDLAERLTAKHPDRLTTEQRKDKRGERIFLDILRNAYGQTAVAPYSLRARPGAPVATPVAWDEVDSKLAPDRWTLETIFRRLSQKDDPWRDIGRKAVKPDPETLKRLD